jgi:hypothetical protein
MNEILHCNLHTLPTEWAKKLFIMKIKDFRTNESLHVILHPIDHCYQFNSESLPLCKSKISVMKTVNTITSHFPALHKFLRQMPVELLYY